MAQGKNEVSPVEKSCQRVWRLIAGVHQPRKTRFSPGAFAKSSEASKFAFVRREKRGFSRLMFTRPLKKVKALLKNLEATHGPGEKRGFSR